MPEDYIEEYKHKTQKSKSIYDLANTMMPGGVAANVKYFAPYPIFMKKADGIILEDVDNNKYLDYCLAFGPLILGHNHPEVIKAIEKQLSRDGTTIFGTPHLLELEMAQKVKELIPGTEKVRFTNSGSEATLLALKLARAFTKKPKIARFEGHYHGWYDEGVISMSPPYNMAGDAKKPSAVSGSFGTPEYLIQNTIVLPFNDLESTKEILKSNKDIAAVILEPVARGFIPSDKDFLEGLYEITRELNIVLIFDEVMSGFRVALNGAAGIYGVIPDLTTLGKIIGGGFPMGAVSGKKEILDTASPLKPQESVFHSGTFNGTPTILAAGLETLNIISRENRFSSFLDQTESFKKSIQQILDLNKVEAQVIGVGANFVVLFTSKPVKNYRDLSFENKTLRENFDYGMLVEGIYIHPHKPFYTSFVHKESDFFKSLKIVEKVIKNIV